MRLLAAVVFVTALPFIPVPRAPQEARDQMLVDVTWLQRHLRDPEVVLLHVGERAEFDREHIPGARFITMSDLAAPMQHTPNMDHGKEPMLELPSPEAARAKLESLGISDNSRIIVYYGNDWVSPSTRIVHTLNWLGLGPRTSLLDGGMPAWKKAGGAVTTEAATIKAGKLSAKPVQEVTVDANFVRANLKTPGVRIIDARDAVFYDGVQGGARPGHIAGAGSLPFTEVTNDANGWRSAAELRALFERAGYKRGDTIIAYCHIGQQATAVVFAARTLGYKVVLYDGSYTQWEMLPDTPTEKTQKDRP